MKIHWTVGKRMWLLSLSLICIIGLIGLFPLELNKFYGEKITKLSEILVPAVKHITFIDMLHDDIDTNVGIQSRVLESKKFDDLEDIIKHQEHDIDVYMLHFNDLMKLEFTKEINEILNKTFEISNKYIEQAKKLNDDTKNKKIDEFKKDQIKFKEVLASLDNSIIGLSASIQTYSKDISTGSAAFKKNAYNLNIIIQSLALILGIFFSIFSIRRLNLKLNKIVHSLSEETEKISQSAVNLADTSSDLSDLTKRQAAAVAETAASMEEMSSMLTQTSKHSASNMEVVD